MRRIGFGLIAVVAAVMACKSNSGTPAAGSRGSITVVMAYGSEKKTWIDESVQAFEASGAKTAAGKRIHIDARAMGSGEAADAIADGTLKPTVFSPASGAYVAVLNEKWLSNPGHVKPISPAGEPVVLSPIVIAMWKPMAEALGWPEKSLGWNDLLSVAANPKGWGAKGHPEWGTFKLGHTHPEFSNSGLLAVLAEAYAGAKKTRGLTADDLSSKETTAMLAKVEGTIVHYGKSTGFFADKMLARGPGYLSCAILYENLVVESYSKNVGAPFPLVAIYPVEGTFWSDHPFAILDAEWVGPEDREAAQAFLTFLKTKPRQERALALGFRPADPAIATTAPIDAAHGVDPKQPQTALEVPDGKVLRKLVEVWSATKKSTDVILVVDKSGSMNGKPLEQAKQGAKAFLDDLTDRDEVSILYFDQQLYPLVGPLSLGKGKAALVSSIDGMIASGGTALYDAIAEAYRIAKLRAEKEPGKIHAVVVMTDGADTNSTLSLESLQRNFNGEDRMASPVKIFTIAYGDQAQTKVLTQIADAAQGSSSKGSTQDIVQVYRDMASFF